MDKKRKTPGELLYVAFHLGKKDWDIHDWDKQPVNVRIVWERIADRYEKTRGDVEPITR